MPAFKKDMKISLPFSRQLGKDSCVLGIKINIISLNFVLLP